MPAILKLSCLKIVERRHLVAPSNKRINASPPSSTFSKRGPV